MQSAQFHNERTLISACQNKHIVLGVDNKGKLFKAGLLGRLWIWIKDVFSKGEETNKLEKTVLATLRVMKMHVDVVQRALQNEAGHLPNDNNLLYYVWTYCGFPTWNKIQNEKSPLDHKLNPFSFSVEHMKSIEHSKQLLSSLILKPESDKDSFGIPCTVSAKGIHHVKNWDSNVQLQQFKDNQKIKNLVGEIGAFTQFSFIPEGPSKDFLSIFYRKSFKEQTKEDIDKLKSIDFVKGKINSENLSNMYFK